MTNIIFTHDLALETLEEFLIDTKNFSELNNNISKSFLKALETQGVRVRENRDEIRRCVSDFYYQHGFHVILIFQKNRTLKIIPSLYSLKNNFHVIFLVHYLEKHYDSTQELTEDIFRSIYQYTDENIVPKDGLLCRDVTRAAIKEFFHFDIRDSLFFKNLDLHIKKFDYEFVQINQELHRIRKLDSSVLLSEADQSYITYLLRKTPLKTYLTTIVDRILKEKITLNQIHYEDFCQDFLHLVAQEFRIQIGKVLGDSISSLNQSCFTEEYIRSHKKLIFSSLAHFLLKTYYHKEPKENSIFTQYSRIPINNPAFKKPDRIFYSPQEVETICQEYFQFHDQIQEIQDKVKDIERQIDEKNLQTTQIQKEMKERNAILQNLNRIYESKKNEARKIEENDRIKQEMNSIAMSNVINEQKVVLQDLEKMAKDMESINKEKSSLGEKKNIFITEIQKIRLASQTQEKNYNSLTQSLGEIIFQNEL